MMHRSLLLSALLAPGLLVAQELYFPPLLGNVWETTDPEALGWCTDQIPPLLQLLEDNDTKAFLVLKDGRIVIEHYFGTFTQDSSWYWASAGKSLTAFLVAMAQEDGTPIAGHQAVDSASGSSPTTGRSRHRRSRS